MAIYVLTLIMIHLFIKSFTTFDKSNFLTLVILSLFAVLIKPSSIIFLILSIIIFTRFYIYTRSQIKYLIALLIVILFVIIFKNVWLTGHPFFPLNIGDSIDLAWQIPSDISTYFSTYGKAYGYHLNPEVFESATWSVRLKNWLLAPGLHGVFNKAMVLLFIMTPLVIYKFYNKKTFWILYLCGIINLLFLFTISPQYRFFFPFIMIFTLMLCRILLVHLKVLKFVLSVSTLLTAIPLFFAVNNEEFTANEYHQVPSQFSTNYILQPYGLSKYSEDFNIIYEGDTQIHTPSEIDFFWGTGNIPLPAINQKQLEYFKTYFQVVPMQATENLKHGFISKRVKKNN